MKLRQLNEARYAGNKDTRLVARIFNEAKKRESKIVINDIARWIATMQADHILQDGELKDVADMLLHGVPKLLDDPKQMDRDISMYFDRGGVDEDESLDSLVDAIVTFVRTGYHQ